MALDLPLLNCCLSCTFKGFVQKHVKEKNITLSDLLQGLVHDIYEWEKKNSS